MKKLLTFALICSLLFSLCACGSSLKEPVRFYYLRHPDHVVFGSEDGLIASEEREASGHINDLNYLLTLYLVGPLDPDLVSPIPQGTQLENLVIRQDGLIIVMNEKFSRLTGVELTAACYCISATCFSLADISEVTIITSDTDQSQGIHITMTRDSVTLIDNSLPLPVPSEGS